MCQLQKTRYCNFVWHILCSVGGVWCIVMYKGVSKSPRTMLITRKSLVVHEFPARVCCGGVL